MAETAHDWAPDGVWGWSIEVSAAWDSAAIGISATLGRSTQNSLVIPITRNLDSPFTKWSTEDGIFQILLLNPMKLVRDQDMQILLPGTDVWFWMRACKTALEWFWREHGVIVEVLGNGYMYGPKFIHISDCQEALVAWWEKCIGKIWKYFTLDEKNKNLIYGKDFAISDSREIRIVKGIPENIYSYIKKWLAAQHDVYKISYSKLNSDSRKEVNKIFSNMSLPFFISLDWEFWFKEEQSRL